MSGTRTVRRKRTITVGSDRYKIGTKATRTVAREGNTRTVTLAKKGGGAIVKTMTKSDDAKNAKIGAWARKAANHVKNDDGSVTYTKKNGGTVTVNKSVTGDPRKKR